MLGLALELRQRDPFEEDLYLTDAHQDRRATDTRPEHVPAVHEFAKVPMA